MPAGVSALLQDAPGRFQSSHPCNLQKASHTPSRKNKQKPKQTLVTLMGF